MYNESQHALMQTYVLKAYFLKLKYFITIKTVLIK
jgi:hypothetical protein